MGTASTGISIISFTTTLNHFHNNLKLFDTSPIFHKWNGAQLLVISMVYTNCLTSCRTT